MLIEVFDPVLCCSSGICGPSVDPALVRFAADLRWAEENGGKVNRFNLGQNPMAFVQNEAVRDELTRSGEAALPLILVDGRIALRGRYPGREELAAWLKGAPAAGVAERPDAGCGCRGGC
jgi:Arsenical resistance operon protein ArsD